MADQGRELRLGDQRWEVVGGPVDVYGLECRNGDHRTYPTLEMAREWKRRLGGRIRKHIGFRGAGEVK